MVLAAVDPRAKPASPTAGIPGARRRLYNARTLSGMLRWQVAAESMVRDVGWITMDSGKRIERDLAVGLLRATMTTVHQPGRAGHHRGRPGGLQIVGHLPAAQPGQVSIAAVADLLLDAENRGPNGVSSTACAPICAPCPARRVRRGLSASPRR